MHVRSAAAHTCTRAHARTHARTGGEGRSGVPTLHLESRSSGQQQQQRRTAGLRRTASYLESCRKLLLPVLCKCLSPGSKVDLFNTALVSV